MVDEPHCIREYIHMAYFVISPAYSCFNQVLSATLEWSVISLLKHFVFCVIVFAASVTWLVVFLAEKDTQNSTEDDVPGYQSAGGQGN